jgi:chemotaxis response regulator CheB
MWGGWGIYSPNHQKVVVGRLLSHGALDSPVRHRTLSGAPATSAGRWVLTVGALTGGASGLSVVHRTGPVDCPVRRLALL